MITVTPISAHFDRTNQDCDERQALLLDLSHNPRDYLAHADASVRSLADWTMEGFGLRCLRPGSQMSREDAQQTLGRLYRRLREVQS